MQERWVICASGPSLKRTNMKLIRAQCNAWRVMTVNNAWKRAPWAHVHYAGDEPWWTRYGDEAMRLSPSEHWTRDRPTALARGIRFVRALEGHGLCTLPNIIHKGGNSGFQAINLAFHLGAREIVLVGYDMSRRFGGHFDGEHDGLPLSAPEKHIICWRNMMAPMADDLARLGVKVTNCSVHSELECFPRAKLKDMLQ
jgi:hypothetical protein